MAFSKSRSGDRLLIQQGISTEPKGYVAANYVAAWAKVAGVPGTGPGKSQTAPMVGDLVKMDPTADDSVQQCVASDVIYGMVWSVNSSSGTLSVLRFDKILQVQLEMITTSASVALGNSVQANGTAGTKLINGVYRDQVKAVNWAAGSGAVWSKLGTGSGVTPFLVVVEFPSLAVLTGGTNQGQ